MGAKGKATFHGNLLQASPTTGGACASLEKTVFFHTLNCGRRFHTFYCGYIRSTLVPTRLTAVPRRSTIVPTRSTAGC